jgi:putative NADH-flavin reductase
VIAPIKTTRDCADRATLIDSALACVNTRNRKNVLVAIDVRFVSQFLCVNIGHTKENMATVAKSNSGRQMKPEDWGFPGWLTPDQEKALAELRETLLKQGVFSKKSLMPDQHLLRFLRARDFNVKKTLDMLVGDLEWRKAFEGITFKYTDFPQLFKFMKTGAIYRAGYDLGGRPVIVSNLARLYPRDVADVSEIPKFWVAYVHYVNMECEKAGVTDYTCIADLSGFSPSKNFSLAMVKILIDILQNYYPERLAYALILHTPMAFRMLWNMIAPFLEERTKAKVHILGSSMNLLTSYVAKDQLEECFGGSHKPYPLPDHVAQQLLGDGITVTTGYFDDETVSLATASAPSLKQDKKLSRTMSKPRLEKMRSLLGRFDTLKKVASTAAIETPKGSPRVTIFGATGRTGVEVVKKALEAGYDVCAFVRTDGAGVPASFLKLQVDYGNEKLQIVLGNINDPLDLDRAIETSDAVISCIGAPPSLGENNDFFVASANAITSAMERNGTRRLVVVTAAQAKRMSKAWYDSNASIADNASRTMYWQTHYKHIAELERSIEAKTDLLDFTFIRPAQLDEKSTDESYQVEPDTFFINGGPLPRPALAQFIVQECVSKKKYFGQGVAIAARQ